MKESCFAEKFRVSVYEIQSPLNPAPSMLGKQVLDLPSMRQNRICHTPHRGTIALHEWPQSGARTSSSSVESHNHFPPRGKTFTKNQPKPPQPLPLTILKPQCPASQIHTLNPFTQTPNPFIVIPSLVGPWLQFSHDGSEGHPTWTPGRRSQPKEKKIPSVPDLMQRKAKHVKKEEEEGGAWEERRGGDS